MQHEIYIAAGISVVWASVSVVWRPMLAPGSDVHSLAAPFAIRVLVYNLYSSTTILEKVLIP